MYRKTKIWTLGLSITLAMAFPAIGAEEVNMLRATGVEIDGNPEEWNLSEFGTISLGGQDSNGDVALIGYHEGVIYYGERCTEASCDLPSDTQDFRARVWSRHDDTFIYYLIRFDDENKQCPNGASANWANDCAEIYIDPANDGGTGMTNTSDIQLVVDRCGQVNVYTTTTAYQAQVLAGVTVAATDTLFEGYNGSWIEVRILKSVLDPDLDASTGDFGVNFNFRDNDGSVASILDWAGDWTGSGGFPTKRPNLWGDALLDSTAIPNLTLLAKAASAITIDGNSSDWDLGTFTMPIEGGTSGDGDIAVIGSDGDSVHRGGFCPGYAMPDDAADHSVTVYSVHDASYQYFLARFEDDDLQSPNPVGMNWANDCIEFYMDPSNGGGNASLGGSETSNFQLVIDVANQQNVYHATAGYAAQILGGVTSAVTTDANGWTLEVRIDKTVADPDLPAAGVFGVDFNFRDNDNANDPALTSIYAWRDPYHEGATFSCPTKRPKNWGDADNVECVTSVDCDNDLFCDGAETCDALFECQAGTAPVIDDGVGCTVDSCDEGSDTIVHAASNGLCDNGDWCDGDETCDPILDCLAGTAPDCDDTVGCTVDACDEVNDECVNVASNGLCDNGDWCDGAETCDPDLDCVAGTAPDCDDGVGCTIDSCDEVNDECANTASNGLCDNGDWCDGAETCDPVLDCVTGTAPDCDDTVGCTVDSCDEVNDECVNVASNGLCDNGDWCDGVETCDPDLDCVAGTAPDCDDSIGCTLDSCDEVNDECVNVASNGLCDNGDYCDGAEVCDELLDCQPGTDPCLLTQWCYEASDQCVDYGDGDVEPDGDVDLLDFMVFQQCFGQLGLAGCQPVNLMGDGLIDLDDYDAFAPILEASGPQ